MLRRLDVKHWLVSRFPSAGLTKLKKGSAPGMEIQIPTSLPSPPPLASGKLGHFKSQVKRHRYLQFSEGESEGGMVLKEGNYGES